VSGTSSFFCGAPMIQQSIMQKIVALSVTDAKIFVATTMTQDMIYVKHHLESILE